MLRKRNAEEVNIKEGFTLNTMKLQGLRKLIFLIQ